MVRTAKVTARSSGLSTLGELAEFRFQMRRFLHFSEASAERQGISVQQYQLLQVVGTAGEGGRASIGEIAGRMILRHHSAVELVDRAERIGLVERLTDELDGRRSMVRLTGRGEELATLIAADHLRELAEAGPRLIESCRRAMAAGRISDAGSMGGTELL